MKNKALIIILTAAAVLLIAAQRPYEGRRLPQPEPTYSAHTVITLEGDTVPCMMVEHWGAIALDCDWR